MATMAFRSTNFRPDTREKIDRMVSIVEEYAQQGLRLTARQLYYQFVSRDLCPNTPAEYKKLTTVLVDARYAGLVDWDSIEDRGRVPDRPSEWRDLNSLVESALRSYRLRFACLSVSAVLMRNAWLGSVLKLLGGLRSTGWCGNFRRVSYFMSIAETT